MTVGVESGETIHALAAVGDTSQSAATRLAEMDLAADVGDSQARALAHVRARAALARPLAKHAPLESLGALGELARSVVEHARVTLSFHPDRRDRRGRLVAEGLADGRYASQFETGLSNGSRTAFPGGARDEWEAQLFGGAYRAADVRAADRPKYGALNVLSYVDGASPRFGSCYFVLKPRVNVRCSFTWGDSHQGPEHVGTFDVFEPVLAALLGSVVTTGAALATPNMDGESLVGRLRALSEMPVPHSTPPLPPVLIGRALDEYIEAQVHGEVTLEHDVESLVIDPSFVGTEVGDVLAALASRHHLPLTSHCGFVLDVPFIDVPDDFRGAHIRVLAERLARLEGRSPLRIDAAGLGRAAQSLHESPEKWADLGTPDEVAQRLKQLWHVIVRFGAPAVSTLNAAPEARSLAAES